MRSVAGSVPWLIAGLLFLASLQLWNSVRKFHRERDQLAIALARSAQTVEVKEGLFQKTSAELKDVTSVLDGSRKELERLRELLKEQESRLVYHAGVSLRWKRKYEELASTVGQTEEPPIEPDGLSRIRVDFSQGMGPFDVSGHTLTSPPEAFLVLEQVRPIELGISLVQGRDGLWSTVVDTPDGSDYDIDVTVSAVDSALEREGWRKRISLDVGVGIYDSMSMSFGARYGGSISVGPRCSAFLVTEGMSWSCGAEVSWRPFDR